MPKGGHYASSVDQGPVHPVPRSDRQQLFYAAGLLGDAAPSARLGTYYCIDCRIPAQTLGWATPGPTCTRCPNRVRFATTELCGTCKWTLKRRNTR